MLEWSAQRIPRSRIHENNQRRDHKIVKFGILLGFFFPRPLQHIDWELLLGGLDWKHCWHCVASLDWKADAESDRSTLSFASILVSKYQNSTLFSEHISKTLLMPKETNKQSYVMFWNYAVCAWSATIMRLSFDWVTLRVILIGCNATPDSLIQLLWREPALVLNDILRHPASTPAVIRPCPL